jgi:hypothetical protein
MFTLSIICLVLYYALRPKKEKITNYVERKEPRQTLKPNYIDEYEHHQVLMSTKEFEELQKQREYEDKAMMQN